MEHFNFMIVMKNDVINLQNMISTVNLKITKRVFETPKKVNSVLTINSGLH